MVPSLPSIQTAAPRVNFLIAGVQKAGTTALNEFLSAHPYVFMPDREIHYFDNEKIDWNHPNYASYDRKFRTAPPHKIVGEKTPIYMYWANSIERIHAYNPAIKLIIILRDPVQRAYSHWKMQVVKGLETLPFSNAIRTGRPRVAIPKDIKYKDRRRYSYVERGFYAPQLERIFKHFARDQVLLLEHSELKSDLVSTLDQITTFLNVPQFAPHPDNASIQPDVRHFGPQKIEVLPPKDQDLFFLYDLFSADISATSTLTGLDLSHWRRS